MLRANCLFSCIQGDIASCRTQDDATDAIRWRIVVSDCMHSKFLSKNATEIGPDHRKKAKASRLRESIENIFSRARRCSHWAGPSMKAIFERNAVGLKLVPKPASRPGCPESGAVLAQKPRAMQGLFRLSTGKWRCLDKRCREWLQNTRYCGLLLTCTTDSGTFSSAAVKEL